MQLLAESLVLAVCGGVAGVALAAVMLRIGMPLLAALPFTATVTLDLRILAFATGISLFVAVLVGMLPALRLSTGTGAVALNDVSRGATARNDRARRLSVAAEVAMSVVLLCGALLLFKSLARLQQVDVGARIDRVITMAVDLPWARYPTGHHWAAFYPRLTSRATAYGPSSIRPSRLRAPASKPPGPDVAASKLAWSSRLTRPSAASPSTSTVCATPVRLASHSTTSPPLRQATDCTREPSDSVVSRRCAPAPAAMPRITW